MFAEDRRIRIREILSTRKSVSAAELCGILRVTPATVRRDLAALEAEGSLVRSHGGAVSRISTTSFQPSYQSLERTNREEKQAIAKEAVKLISEGDTLFLEGSTTVFELARLLKSAFSRLIVLTNSPACISQLQQTGSGITVICTGGELRKDTNYLCGLWAEQALERVRLDTAVVGVSAIDPAYGMSAANHAEAQIKKLLCRSARRRIAVADYSKFGRQQFAFVGPVTDVDVLVTDSNTPASHLDAIREAGVHVIVAGAGAGDGDGHTPAARRSAPRDRAPRKRSI
ncbi:MAG: DeoR/GlpR transcriptional regulator [Bryobacterales bacterium]|nr:DeoR/GlpR transcriptional regulator [Bryobacterales bacterium]